MLACVVLGFSVMPPLVVHAAEGEDPDIASFLLDNGLEVVVIPDRRAPVVTHMLWYKVGSADEDAGSSGAAHFLEHLMFKATDTYPAGEFSARVAELGGRENAFTSFDYTAYFQQVAPEELETMMRYEADRMRNLVLTDEEIEVERQVVIEERVQQIENRPESLLSEEISATLYNNHRYGQPVIGWMHEIEALDRATLQDFYDRFYMPSNAVLIVAGDVDEETVRDIAGRTYGEIDDDRPTPPRQRLIEPEPRTDRTVELRDGRVSVPSYTERWLVPSYHTSADGEGEALDLLAEILGGGLRSRLYRALVVEQGIAASAGAFYRGTALDTSLFAVHGTPRGDASLDDVRAAVDAEIARLIEGGVTEDELERAKNRFMRSMIYARDDQSTMARMYGAVLTTGGTVEDLTEWSERIRAVTVEEVQEAARTYLDARPSVTSRLLPAEGDRS